MQETQAAKFITDTCCVSPPNPEMRVMQPGIMSMQSTHKYPHRTCTPHQIARKRLNDTKISFCLDFKEKKNLSVRQNLTQLNKTFLNTDVYQPQTSVRAVRHPLQRRHIYHTLRPTRKEYGRKRGSREDASRESMYKVSSQVARTSF